jgi:5-methylcytosine-specific restriction endonuclease McrA
MTHEHATPASQSICNLIVSLLEREIGDVSMKHAKEVCSLGRPRKFAYVYHRRGSVKVYLQSQESDGENLASLSGRVPLLKRGSMASDWVKLSPYYIELDSATDVAESIPLLVHVARSRMAKTSSREFLLPSEIDASEATEGGRITVHASRFERDPAARKRCLQIFGHSCSVCGFDFKAVYGDIGAGFIHVHHLTPLSMIGKRYKVNAAADLRPVCPNCHEMLHKQKPPLLIEELKARISRPLKPLP